MLNIFSRRFPYRVFWFSTEDTVIKVTKMTRDTKKSIKEQLKEEAQPIPVSPVLGPIEVKNPKWSTKKYRWCSCGLSKTQPFCDDTHLGTKFLPYKFTLEEKVDSIVLCGCKFTTNKPYCDGTTCKTLKKENS